MIFIFYDPLSFGVLKLIIITHYTAHYAHYTLMCLNLNGFKDMQRGSLPNLRYFFFVLLKNYHSTIQISC